MKRESDQNRPYLSLVFPAYNESLRLPASIRSAAGYLGRQGYGSEIIVVDDGSDDGTADAARACLDPAGGIGLTVIRLESNSGKGAAVKAGMTAAAGELVFFADSDLAIPVEQIGDMLGYFEQGHDIVIGSKGLPDSRPETPRPFLRRWGGKVFNLLVRMLILPGIRDTQCGFKGFRGQIVPILTSLQTLNGFAFDVELLWIARRLGFSIVEAPVRWSDGQGSKVSFLRDSFRMLKDIISLRIRHRKTDFGSLSGRRDRV